MDYWYNHFPMFSDQRFVGYAVRYLRPEVTKSWNVRNFVKKKIMLQFLIQWKNVINVWLYWTFHLLNSTFSTPCARSRLWTSTVRSQFLLIFSKSNIEYIYKHLCRFSIPFPRLGRLAQVSLFLNFEFLVKIFAL